MPIEKTHFGYKEVSKDEKQGMVKQVFDSVTDRYDLMNDLMSFGIHRFWKKYTIRAAQLKKEHTILDLAAGTCDLTTLIHQSTQGQGHVIACDINSSMLNTGKNKLIDKGIFQNVEFIQANAECLPFAEKTFDRVLMGFGLRNVTDKLKALNSIYRILKPGGKILVLEFSECTQPALASLYDSYSFSILPKLGKLIAKDQNSYQYLAESIRKHENQEALKGLFEQAGFENCSYQNILYGIVALHVGFKF